MDRVLVNGSKPETARETSAATTTGTMVVAQPLEFKFNQMELQSLAKHSGPNMISVSMCAFADGEGLPKEMYLCAFSHLAPTTAPVTHPINTRIRAIIGCPFPPPWKTDDGLAVINPSEIAGAPKFFILATTLLNALKDNTHAPIDLADPNNAVKQVSAILEAEVNGTTGELETFVSFVMKDASGVQVGNALRAISL